MGKVKAYPTTDKCQSCGGDLKSGKHYYDARHTIINSWGWFCEDCFTGYNMKLGTGRGQEFNSTTNEKVRG